MPDLTPTPEQRAQRVHRLTRQLAADGITHPTIARRHAELLDEELTAAVTGLAPTPAPTTPTTP